MRFSENYEWIEKEGEIATIGLTSYAQKELGEVVYLELPAIGKFFSIFEEICLLESSKAALDLYAPVSGKVIAVHTELQKNLEMLQEKKEIRDLWLFKIQMSQPEEYEELMDETTYNKWLSKKSFCL